MSSAARLDGYYPEITSKLFLLNSRKTYFFDDNKRRLRFTSRSRLVLTRLLGNLPATKSQFPLCGGIR